MSQNWTKADLKAHMAKTGGVVPAVKRAPRPKMNKTEARYAKYLELMVKAGEITAWRFEEMTFKLAPDCRLTPDFFIVNEWEAPNDIWVRDITIADTKGFKRKKNGADGFWIEEDSRVKLKLAARLWPWFRWCIVFPKSNGEWEEVEFHA
jgi:hypothetical protein